MKYDFVCDWKFDTCSQKTSLIKIITYVYDQI
jgi:hypothetical protein